MTWNSRVRGKVSVDVSHPPSLTSSEETFVLSSLPSPAVISNALLLHKVSPLAQDRVRDNDALIKKEAISNADINRLSLGLDCVNGENSSRRFAQLRRCARWVRPEDLGVISHAAICPRYCP